MNISYRTIAAIALTSLLTACGAGQSDTEASMTLGSAVQSDLTVAAGGAAAGAAAANAGTASASAASAAAGTALAAAPTGPAVAPAAGPNNPTPDCAAEGCSSLRIIDGNAEAYRLDAMRQAAAADDNAVTQL